MNSTREHRGNDENVNYDYQDQLLPKGVGGAGSAGGEPSRAGGCAACPGLLPRLQRRDRLREHKEDPGNPEGDPEIFVSGAFLCGGWSWRKSSAARSGT